METALFALLVQSLFLPVRFVYLQMLTLYGGRLLPARNGRVLYGSFGGDILNPRGGAIESFATYQSQGFPKSQNRLECTMVSRRDWLTTLWATLCGMSVFRSGFAAEKNKAKAIRTQISRLKFSGVPYRYAVQRVAETLHVSVLIDRRLDPDASVEFVLDRPTEGLQIFQKLASFQKAVAMEWDDLIFLTPESSVQTIAAVRKRMAADLKRAKTGVRAALLRKRRVQWSDYTQPRPLIERWCESESGCGGVPERIEDVPYDLIAAAELPPMTLVDRVTLIAIQYDLSLGMADDGSKMTFRYTKSG